MRGPLPVMSEKKPSRLSFTSEKPDFDLTPGYANYVLGVLFVVYVFNFIDRQVLSVFIGPIKAEFGASDTAMGLLVGFAFALLYTFAGIPIARWADRGNRRSIIAIGLAVWSAMTVATGLARSFTQLVLARVGVGVGEAAGTPPAHSLISDYFPVHRRGRALAIYSSGLFVGAACAYLGGGYLREYFDWRTAFIVLGIPGMLFALVVRFTVREPPRGFAEKHRGGTGTSSMADTLTFILKSPSWPYLGLGASLIAIPGYGILMWGFEFFARIHGLSPVEIGQWMALVVGLGGCLGTLLGGFLADTLGRKKPALGLIVPAAFTFAGMPLTIAFLLVESSALSLASFFAAYVLLNVYIPAVFSVNHSLVRLHMRATASAIVLFVVNIVGAGAGPFIVGWLSDYYAPIHAAESIRYALASVCIATGLGSLCLIYCGFTLEKGLKYAGNGG